MDYSVFDEGVAYTPGNALPFTPHAIKVGTAGTLVITDRHGHTFTWPAQAGELIKFRAIAIGVSSTAGGLVILRCRQSVTDSSVTPLPPPSVEDAVTNAGVNVTHLGETVTHTEA